MAMVEYCMDHFFNRLFPTIPILTPEYVAYRKDAANGASATAIESRSLLHAVCAFVLLQAEDPGSHVHIGPVSETPATSGLEHLQRATAMRTHGSEPARVSPSLEVCLHTFFLYACHAAMLHHSRAFFYVRETSTLWQLHAAHPRTENHPHAFAQQQNLLGCCWYVNALTRLDTDAPSRYSSIQRPSRQRIPHRSLVTQVLLPSSGLLVRSSSPSSTGKSPPFHVLLTSSTTSRLRSTPRWIQPPTCTPLKG